MELILPFVYYYNQIKRTTYLLVYKLIKYIFTLFPSKLGKYLALSARSTQTTFYIDKHSVLE